MRSTSRPVVLRQTRRHRRSPDRRSACDAHRCRKRSDRRRRLAFAAVADIERRRCPGAAGSSNSPSPSRAHRSARPCRRRRRLRHGLLALACAGCAARDHRVRRAGARRPRLPVSGSITSAATLAPDAASEWLPSTLEEAAAVAVGVDVDERLLLQLAACVSAHSVEPSSIGSSRVPAQIDERALGPPAGLRQRADGLGLAPSSRCGRSSDRTRRTPSRRGGCRASSIGRDTRCPSSSRRRRRWSSATNRT